MTNILVEFIHAGIFSNRVVTLWNKLHENVIRSESLNIFKIRLDRLWHNQDLLTNHQSPCN